MTLTTSIIGFTKHVDNLSALFRTEALYCSVVLKLYKGGDQDTDPVQLSQSMITMRGM